MDPLYNHNLSPLTQSIAEIPLTVSSGVCATLGFAAPARVGLVRRRAQTLLLRLLTTMIITSTGMSITLPQEIETTDYVAVQRGSEIAAQCLIKGRTNIFQYTECVTTASDKISNHYERLGFTFHLFVVDALFEEIIRHDKKIARVIKDGHTANLQSALTLIKHYKRTLHLNTSDLCIITKLNCDAAKRVERFWGIRLGLQ
jgi:hypothetical protein